MLTQRGGYPEDQANVVREVDASASRMPCQSPYIKTKSPKRNTSRAVLV